MNVSEFTFVTIAVRDAAQLAAVYALLGGAAPAALAAASRPQPEPDLAKATAEPAPQTQAQTGDDNGGGSPDVSGEIDAHGHPWSAELHASTKGKTKDGLWRMKVGVSRPAPLPGFPKDGAAGQTGATGTGSNGAGAPASGAATGGNAGPAPGEDEDEFAAFRAAAGADAPAAAATTRKWTDADLGALCNQAAVKLGDPSPIKALIAAMVPQGEVAHSRNIPEAQREAFAQKVEQSAGITFAG